MKRSLQLLLLGLALTLGMAIGQGDNAAGQQDDSDAPAVEQPADDNGASGAASGDLGEDAAGDAEAGDDAAGDEASGAETDVDTETDTDVTTPADDITQPEQETEPADDAAAQDGMEADQSIVEVLQGNPDFSMFADALQRAGLIQTLEQEGPFTILAPTNQAFEQSGINLDQLSREEVTSLVRNHIISGMVSAEQLGSLAGIVTLLGNEYAVTPGTEQPVAAEEADGEVAGGGQADAVETPAEPAEPADEAEDADGAAGGAAQDDVDGDVETADQDAAVADTTADADVSIGGARVVQPATRASSGVVFGIDSVLVPEQIGLGGAEGGETDVGAETDAEGETDVDTGVGDEDGAGLGGESEDTEAEDAEAEDTETEDTETEEESLGN